jgi:hypothetical protein
MTKREKTKELFIELFDEQLKYHNVKYEDIKETPPWYMQYSTTKEREKEFIDYCVLRIGKVLKLNKKMALEEAYFFILQWGLPLEESELSNTFKIEDIKN